MVKINKLSQLIAISVCLSLSACSRFESFLDTKNRVKYDNNKTVKVLDFPPDLTSPEFDNEFDLPANTSNTVSMRTGGIISTTTNNATTPTSFNVGSTVNQRSQPKNRRVGRLSNIIKQKGRTVLRINDSYSRSFILTKVMLERMKFSVLSRANNVYHLKYQGQDILKDSKGDNLSKTLEYFKSLTEGYNNKVLANGELYQAHIVNQQGTPLVYFRDKDGSRLASASNTKILTLLDAEFNRQSNQSGQLSSTRSSVNKATSGAVNNRSARGDLSGIKSHNGSSVLQIYDTYPRSLVLMDIMLERTNFTVLSRNSAAGIYTVQYNGDEAGAKKGWFGRVKNAIGLSKNTNGELVKGSTYQISIKNQKGYPLVSFLSEKGQILPVALHLKILTLLNNAFNR